MEKLIREIREIIKENSVQLEAMPTKDRVAWVLLSIANSYTFRKASPRSEEFLTEKDSALGCIHTVSTLIKRILKEIFSDR